MEVLKKVETKASINLDMEKYANFNIVSRFSCFCPAFCVKIYIRKSPKMDFVITISGPP
jgi:hypothetical protein